MIRKGLIYMIDWAKLGCVVAGEAADGQEGIEQIRQLQPDIVLTDVRMPFVNGIAMLERTRHECDYEVIIMSGYDEFEYAKKAISLGVTEYFLKPLDTEELESAMQKITAKLEDKAQVQKLRQAALPSAGNVLNLSVLDIKSSKSRHVQRMMEYLQQNYNQKISLSDLSEALGISASYLNTQFREETGYTFNDFLNRYRILSALRMLSKTDCRVYEVAEQVGFQDYKYFIQVFKKYIGVSPVKFLKSQS